jgi:membrane associated rhomboid family serine protease
MSEPIENSELEVERKKFFRSLIIPTAFLLIIWIVKIAEVGTGADFSSLGIYPLSLRGLPGIILAPLIHANFNHLIDNSIPLYLLMIATWYFYHDVASRVFLFSYLFSGIWLWLGGRSAYHIGASGLIYSFAAFLFVSGIIRNYPRLMAISLLVVFLYGGLVWGLFPLDERVSFESHIFGLVAGVLMAIYYKNTGPQREQYDWGPEDDNEDMIDWKDQSEREKRDMEE